MSRALCPRCQRPLDYCYCSDLSTELADIDLVILQHSRETRHPMNTARIVELGISNCEIWTGEDFTSHQPLLKLVQQKKCGLLFPGPNAQDSQQILQNDKPEAVILIDGTWRKARRIYHLNPILQTLPAITLNHNHLSDYRIRKVPNASALSTLEASVLLLRQASHQADAHQQLLDVFDRMIQMQIDAMGEEVYQKNYGSRLHS